MPYEPLLLGVGVVFKLLTFCLYRAHGRGGFGLSGTPVRVFQTRYTIAIYSIALCFSCVAGYRAIPPKGPLSWGIARLC